MFIYYSKKVCAVLKKGKLSFLANFKKREKKAYTFISSDFEDIFKKSVIFNNNYFKGKKRVIMHPWVTGKLINHANFLILNIKFQHLKNTVTNSQLAVFNCILNNLVKISLQNPMSLITPEEFLSERIQYRLVQPVKGCLERIRKS